MAAEEKTASPPPAASAPADGGGSSKVLLLLTMVNVLVTVAMGGVLFVSFQKEKKASKISDISTHEATSAGEGKEGGEGKKEGGEGKEGEGGAKKKLGEFGRMVTLDQFTVNLSTPGSAIPKYVRVNISLEVPNEDAENEVNQKMPRVRNVVIDLFNSKRPSDLAGAEGRDYIKEEIRNAVNEFMIRGKVKGVFFTNFAVAG